MAVSTQIVAVHVEYFLLQRKTRLNASLLLVIWKLWVCVLRCDWLIYTLLNGRLHSNWYRSHGELLTVPNLLWMPIMRPA